MFIEVGDWEIVHTMGSTIPYAGDSKLYRSRERKLRTGMHVLTHCSLLLTVDMM